MKKLLTVLLLSTAVTAFAQQRWQSPGYEYVQPGVVVPGVPAYVNPPVRQEYVQPGFVPRYQQPHPSRGYDSQGNYAEQYSGYPQNDPRWDNRSNTSCVNAYNQLTARVGTANGQYWRQHQNGNISYREMADRQQWNLNSTAGAREELRRLSYDGTARQCNEIFTQAVRQIN